MTRSDNQCTYCGRAGHRASRCPHRPSSTSESDVQEALGVFLTGVIAGVTLTAITLLLTAFYVIP